VPTVNIVLLSSPVKRAIAGMTYLIQLQIWRLEIWMAKWCTTNICLSCLSFAFTIKLCNNSIFINIKAYCVVRYLFRKWLENLLILVQSHWTDRLYSRQWLHLRTMIKYSIRNFKFHWSLTSKGKSTLSEPIQKSYITETGLPLVLSFQGRLVDVVFKTRSTGMQYK
jgi:hypothetical protein